MTSLKDVHLILFLTKGATLADWHARGFLAREAELYLRLKPHLGSIAWVTYGGKSERDYQDELPGIQILYNRWRLPNQVYIQQLPWLHHEVFQRATILKAEQTGAAEAALTVAGHYGIRLIARSGFSLALFAQYAPDEYNESYGEILALEKEIFQAAQQIVVTTDEMRQTALGTHNLPPKKIRVIPNYVNTARFCPRPGSTEKNNNLHKPYAVFAGRLTAQKNVENLLTAAAPLTHIRLDIIGDGELRDQLAARIQREGLNHIRLVGSVPNRDLPAYFQRADVYVQPSRYEGHPKTIFEAMACGIPVLVGDAPGIRQFVRHRETGWLCDENPESIRAGLETLLADSVLRQRLGAAGRDYVLQNFSLEAVLPQELDMLSSVQAQPNPPAQPKPRPYLRSAWTYVKRTGNLVTRTLFRP